MALYLILHCDVPSCTTEYSLGYILTYLVHDAPLLNAQTVLINIRDEAQKAGWLCTRDGDYCPVHAQSELQHRILQGHKRMYTLNEWKEKEGFHHDAERIGVRSATASESERQAPQEPERV